MPGRCPRCVFRPASKGKTFSPASGKMPVLLGDGRRWRTSREHWHLILNCLFGLRNTHGLKTQNTMCRCVAESGSNAICATLFMTQSAGPTPRAAVSGGTIRLQCSIALVPTVTQSEVYIITRWSRVTCVPVPARRHGVAGGLKRWDESFHTSQKKHEHIGSSASLELSLEQLWTGSKRKTSGSLLLHECFICSFTCDFSD